jgi:hypothetical protein
MWTRMSDQIVKYSPSGPTLKRFHESKAFVRGIMGPIGSAKSTACVIEILRRAQMQRPGPDGIRRSRWAIIRNSYPELKTTTLKTWSTWAPLSFGKVNMDSPFMHHVKAGDLDMEVLFLALDRSEDARKLLSLELTGAWINEAREVPKAILDALTGRVGRYPSKMQGGADWSGVLLDTNPGDTTSWWYKCAEEEEIAGWQFFRQPSGISKEAENLDFLPEKYYERLMAGKDPEWVNVYVNGNYGFLIEGKPVFPQYRDSIHCAAAALSPDPHFGLLIGADFGLTPAAVIAQKYPDGRWEVIDQLVTDNTGVKRFAELLSTYVAINYPEHNVVGAWGDPSGAYGADNEDETALGIMNAVTKWKWLPAPGENTLHERLECVRNVLNRLVDGKPGLAISPKCTTLRKGFANGYHYKLAQSGNGAVVHETPNKNEFSHVHDALQYLLLGGGEFDAVLNRMPDRKKNRPRFAKGHNSGPFD